MAWNLTIWRRGLKTVNMLWISKSYVVFADHWGATSSWLLLVLIYWLILAVWLLLEHVIYFRHIILANLLPLILIITSRHHILFFIQLDSVNVKLLCVGWNFLTCLVLVCDCVGPFHLLVLHCCRWDESTLSRIAVWHGVCKHPWVMGRGTWLPVYTVFLFWKST